jgi:hypothetical protein
MDARYKGEGVLTGCGRYEELIARFLDGDALLQDREELEKHLAVCPDCERLYLGVSEVDRALREYPGKQVEPPPYLRARILANLPDGEADSRSAVWGRWAAGFAAVAAGVIALAIVFLQGNGMRADRVASAPSAAPAVRPSEPSVPRDAPANSVPAETRNAPILKAVPGAAGKRRGGFRAESPGEDSSWETDLRLPPGTYSYNFIVNGELLVPDPNALNQMPDGYGGTNSILLVQGDTAI